ncbi:MAG: hypothetical protein U9O54_03445 [Chloroflexota bacterium]|nr:hypothetical protein [Chloroflexota bacterium]
MQKRQRVQRKERCEEAVTDALNVVYAEEASGLDVVVERLQFASLPVEEWGCD